jgi:uncharacterized membrane protein (Fun14 family)
MMNINNIRSIARIRESFKTRQVRYGGYAALITVAVIIGLILVNLMVEQLSPQIDLTWSKIFSLSDQTIQVLDQVKSPVKFYGLWRPGAENPQITDVINLYMSKNRNISFEVLDPDRNPGFVLKYDKDRRGVSQGSLIVEGEKGFRIIAPYEMYDFTQNQQGQSSVTGVSVERRITSAILYVGTGITPVIYELTGHEERPLSSFGLMTMLDRENYQLNSVNLLTSPVPADAAAIVLYSPQKDLAPAEAEKLLDYLDKGGRFLVAANYMIQELANLNRVLASYGIRFDYGIVNERDPYYVAIDPRTEWPDVEDHDITKQLTGNKDRMPVVLVEAMALSTLDTKRRSTEIKPLMTSSARAFLRTDIDEYSFEMVPSDIPGPLTLGLAAMDPSWIDPNWNRTSDLPPPQTRIVAIGCGNILSIASQGFDANRDLFMNGITWLQDRPESITVRSKSLYLLPMRMNLVQVIIFGALFIAVIPLAFFIAGFVTWLKRRHL